MKKDVNKKTFLDFAERTISDETVEEIENNLKNFFSVLLEWFANSNS